jgi:hypothetical protein
MEAGYEILWPVYPHFLDGLKFAYPLINWVDWRGYSKYLNIQAQVEIDGYLIVPIRWSCELGSNDYKNVMADKYKMYGWDWKEWKDKAVFERDLNRERDLARYLGVHLDKPYTLVNKFFGSNSQFKANIPVNGVEMKTVTGYSLFDYATLLENAQHIHVANSSVLYLLELLDLKAESINLYCRHPLEKDFANTEYLHTKKYNLFI